VIVRFVDIGGIDDHHYSTFLFLIDRCEKSTTVLL